MEQVTFAVCEQIREKFDERFSRDKERLDKLDATMERLSELTIKMAGLLESTIKEQREQRKEQREQRADIAELKKRPGAWLDKIIAALLTAAVSAFVAFVVSGGLG